MGHEAVTGIAQILSTVVATVISMIFYLKKQEAIKEERVEEIRQGHIKRLEEAKCPFSTDDRTKIDQLVYKEFSKHRDIEDAIKLIEDVKDEMADIRRYLSDLSNDR